MTEKGPSLAAEKTGAATYGEGPQKPIISVETSKTNPTAASTVVRLADAAQLTHPEPALQRAMRASFEAADMAERQKHPLPIYPPGQALHFHREIFFAGFPCFHPHESAFKDVPGGAAAVADTAVYSSKTVYSAFEAYGKIDEFTYDKYRGMGCVVYSRGEDAESCFLSMNNAVIPGPVADPNVKTLQEVDQIGFGSFEDDRRVAHDALASGSSSGGDRVKDYIITCEFARCLPFVTPFLMLKDEFGSLELSRSLMRHFPVPESAAGGRLGQWISAAWMMITANQTNAITKEFIPGTTQHIPVLVGPMFNDGENDQDCPLFQAMFNLLKPRSFVKKIGLALHLVDMWWEYYHLYMLHKTEPTPDRIRSKREFLSASCATITQEIVGLKRDCWERNIRIESTSPSSLLRRLAFDDVFHCTLNAIIMKQKFKLDPAFASFMRDVHNERTTLEYKRYRQRCPFTPDPDALRLMRQIEKVVTQADRENDEEGRRVRQRCFTEDDAKLNGFGLAPMRSGGGEGVQDGTKRQDASPGAGGPASREAGDGEDAKASLRADIVYSLHPKVQKWMSMPLLEVTANVIENVKFLRKVKKGLIGPDGSEFARPMRRPEDTFNDPGLSTKQEDADLYDEITTNLNGFCADGSLFSFLLLGEDPAAFRGEKGHLGFEENAEYHAKRSRSLWRDCKGVSKALIVPVVFVAALVMLISYVFADREAGEAGVPVAGFWDRVETPSPVFSAPLRARGQRDPHAASPPLHSSSNCRKSDKGGHGEGPAARPRLGRKPHTQPTTTAAFVSEDDLRTGSSGTMGEAAAHAARHAAASPAQGKTPEELAELLRELKEMSPEQLAQARQAAAQKAREMMQRAQDEAAKRGAKFNIGFSADL